MSEKNIATHVLKYSAAIITGGSSGIGEAFISTLKRLNPTLAVCNISRKNTSDKQIFNISADLSRPQDVEKATEGVKQWLSEKVPQGRVLLINNSGFGAYGLIQDLELDNQLSMMDLNMKAIVALTGSLLPVLMERGGAVMNVASTAAFQPTPFMTTYGATKAFVMHWTLALNADLDGTGVKAMCLCPGPTATRFFTSAGFNESPLPGWVGHTSEQVAMIGLKGLAGGKTLVTCGFQNKFLCGISGKLPRVLVTRLTANTLNKFRMKALKAKKSKASA